MSFYLPRERKGPGFYESEGDIAAWWETNKGKSWNPERGLYVHDFYLETPAINPPQPAASLGTNEGFVDECKTFTPLDVPIELLAQAEMAQAVGGVVAAA